MAGLMLFSNNAATTLATSINSSVTSLTVATGTGVLFPNPTGGQYFYMTLANVAGTVEIVKVTARSTDTFTIVRGQDGSSASSWVSGDKVEQRVVAVDLNNFGQLDSTNTWALAQTFTSGMIGNVTGNVSGSSASITGVNAIATGGTAASTAATARTNLGVAIGSDVLAYVVPGTSGNLLTSNGSAWTSAAPPATGGMTLLGTLSTPSGTSASLTGLTLTGYKQLLCVMNGVQLSSYSATKNISFGTAQLTSITTSPIYGQFWVDLTTGYTAVIASATANLSAATGYSTATTTLTITSGTVTFTGGSLLVYGVK